MRRSQRIAVTAAAATSAVAGTAAAFVAGPAILEDANRAAADSPSSAATSVRQEKALRAALASWRAHERALERRVADARDSLASARDDRARARAAVAAAQSVSTVAPVVDPTQGPQPSTHSGTPAPGPTHTTTGASGSTGGSGDDGEHEHEGSDD